VAVLKKVRPKAVSQRKEMPIYEYECQACGHRFEEWQKMSDAPVRVCPKCQEEKVEKLISQSSFHLKGGGWYSDLYSSSGKGSASSTASTSSTTGKPSTPAASSTPSSSGSGGSSSSTSSGDKKSGGST